MFSQPLLRLITSPRAVFIDQSVKDYFFVSKITPRGSNRYFVQFPYHVPNRWSGVNYKFILRRRLRMGRKAIAKVFFGVISEYFVVTIRALSTKKSEKIRFPVDAHSRVHFRLDSSTDDILWAFIDTGSQATLATNPQIFYQHTHDRNNRLSLHNYTLLDVLPFQFTICRIFFFQRFLSHLFPTQLFHIFYFIFFTFSSIAAFAQICLNTSTHDPGGEPLIDESKLQDEIFRRHKKSHFRVTTSIWTKRKGETETDVKLNSYEMLRDRRRRPQRNDLLKPEFHERLTWAALVYERRQRREKRRNVQIIYEETTLWVYVARNS